MAVDKEFDRFTKWKLKKILKGKYDGLKKKTLAEFIGGEEIAEVMSGVGRHVPTYDEFKPKSITLVD